MCRGQSQCLLSPSFSTLFFEPGSLTDPLSTKVKGMLPCPVLFTLGSLVLHSALYFPTPQKVFIL